jgi:four helix bundle protein
MEYLTLDKIDAYVLAYDLSNEVWDLVTKWEKFERWTIGIQMTRSVDSISANIAEGFGRYHKKDKIRFYRYSFGSMEETKDWIKKASDRKLVTIEKANYLKEELDKMPKLINQLIQYTNQKLKY